MTEWVLVLVVFMGGAWNAPAASSMEKVGGFTSSEQCASAGIKASGGMAIGAPPSARVSYWCIERPAPRRAR